MSLLQTPDDVQRDKLQQDYFKIFDEETWAAELMIAL